MNLKYAGVGHFLADEQSKQLRKTIPDQEDALVHGHCDHARMLRRS
jgi:hypothetical protein